MPLPYGEVFLLYLFPNQFHIDKIYNNDNYTHK